MEAINLKEVMEILRLSESTIRRRLRDRREGKSSFPTPFTGTGHKRKALWWREEIEEWKESDSDIPNVETTCTLKRRQKIAQNGLARLGVKTIKTK